MAALTGVEVPIGFVGSVRGRAAALVEAGFLPHVGGRSADDIDAGGILEGFTRALVRDGYAGYGCLEQAEHAWCGAHLLRDLKAVHDHAAGDSQVWAEAMATTLARANAEAVAARAVGRADLDPEVLAGIRNSYRGALAQGFADNTSTTTLLAKDALRLARRFRDHENMILTFVTNLAVPWTNNQAERDLRPVKVQLRASGGTWRTLQGLTEFAIIPPYLSTATKWSIGKLEALTRLFTTGPWHPHALSPTA